MPDMLENLTYSVFGLGNSSYEQYNAAAKVVDKSAHALGAVRLLKIHLGDDDCTLEDDFQGWRRGPGSLLSFHPTRITHVVFARREASTEVNARACVLCCVVLCCVVLFFFTWRRTAYDVRVMGERV